MSADNQVTVPVVAIVEQIVEKKQRKPSLPEKFGKFIQFGFFFMKQYNDSHDVKIDENSFLESLNMFANVDEQQTFVQTFFTNSKENKKNMRKFLQNHNKALAKAAKIAAAPPKPDKKPRAKKTKTAPTEPLPESLDTPINVSSQVSETTETVQPVENAQPTETKTKVSRKKPSKAVSNTQDDLVNELVKRASSTHIPPSHIPPSDIPTTSDIPPSASPAKSPKKKSNDDKPLKKPRATKTSTAPPTAPPTATPTNDDADDSADVSLFEFQGKQYLIDDLSRVYDLNTQDEIGRFDPSSNSLNLY
jgi:hypothetical protein